MRSMPRQRKLCESNFLDGSTLIKNRAECTKKWKSETVNDLEIKTVPLANSLPSDHCHFVMSSKLNQFAVEKSWNTFPSRSFFFLFDVCYDLFVTVQWFSGAVVQWHLACCTWVQHAMAMSWPQDTIRSLIMPLEEAAANDDFAFRK